MTSNEASAGGARAADESPVLSVQNATHQFGSLVAVDNVSITAGRGEFLTAYVGESYADHGKWQAFFEYCSLMAELLDMEVLSCPLYDGAQAASTSIRSINRPSIISVHESHSPQGVDETPCSQFRQLARIRAMVVLPVPRVPVNKYAWCKRSLSSALTNARTACS